MRKITIMLGLLAALMTVALAGVADARQGADDPVTHDVGDDRGGLADDDPATHDVGDDNGSGGQGADDPVGHVRHSGDDDGRRKRCRNSHSRARHARRGDDDGGRRGRSCRRHGRGSHHGPNHR